MKELKEFASFLRKNHLEQLAEENIDQIMGSNLPILNLLKEFPKEELVQLNKINLEQLLNNLENGIPEAIESGRKNIELWSSGEHPQLKDTMLHPTDLVRIYSIQHNILIKYIRDYTRDIDKAFTIIHELGEYYTQMEDMGFNALFMIREGSEQKLKEMVDKLEMTTEELKRSNQELSQFAYMASHDLQEPLRMVSSYMQLLQRRYSDKLDKTANEFIEYAVDGTKRMKQLIDDLLQYSRVGRGEFKYEEIDLNEVMEEVLINITRQVEENKAVIKFPSLPVVQADGMRMIQLFQNLLHNAIKFRGAEDPEIEIKVEENQEEWIFSVSDNGIGIKEEFKDRIFVIFQRLHGREQYPGTGIGLAVCKKIVERHGGRIWMESEPEKGSVFHFTLKKKIPEMLQSAA